MNYLNAFKAFTAGEFEDAAASYRAAPSADNWNRLIAAMKAHQFLWQKRGQDWAMEHLPSARISQIIDLLGKAAEAGFSEETIAAVSKNLKSPTP